MIWRGWAGPGLPGLWYVSKGGRGMGVWWVQHQATGDAEPPGPTAGRSTAPCHPLAACVPA
jgi:hypothetical protein